MKHGKEFKKIFTTTQKKFCSSVFQIFQYPRVACDKRGWFITFVKFDTWWLGKKKFI